MDTKRENKGGSRNCDRVVVRGEPILLAVTLSVADGTLEPAWTVAEEATYRGE